MDKNRVKRGQLHVMPYLLRHLRRFRNEYGMTRKGTCFDNGSENAIYHATRFTTLTSTTSVIIQHSSTVMPLFLSVMPWFLLLSSHTCICHPVFAFCHPALGCGISDYLALPELSKQTLLWIKRMFLVRPRRCRNKYGMTGRECRMTGREFYFS